LITLCVEWRLSGSAGGRWNDREEAQSGHPRLSLFESSLDQQETCVETTPDQSIKLGSGPTASAIVARSGFVTFTRQQEADMQAHSQLSAFVKLTSIRIWLRATESSP
jgi:hypothetical protein